MFYQTIEKWISAHFLFPKIVLETLNLRWFLFRARVIRSFYTIGIIIKMEKVYERGSDMTKNWKERLWRLFFLINLFAKSETTVWHVIGERVQIWYPAGNLVPHWYGSTYYRNYLNLLYTCTTCTESVRDYGNAFSKDISVSSLLTRPKVADIVI